MVRIKIVDTPLLDPLFNEGITRHTPPSPPIEAQATVVAQKQDASNDETDDERIGDLIDPSYGEPCPFCDKLDCEDHLLACFDEDGEGDFHVGLIGGTLLDIEEIGTIYEKICLALVNWMRGGRDEDAKPSWITNDPILLGYFDWRYKENKDFQTDYFLDDDEAAVDAVLSEVDRYDNRLLLEDLCRRCGWTGFNKREYGPDDKPLQSTSYDSLYDPNPKEVAAKLRAVLKTMIESSKKVS